jgi:hypothetical protein
VWQNRRTISQSGRAGSGGESIHLCNILIQKRLFWSRESA